MGAGKLASEDEDELDSESSLQTDLEDDDLDLLKDNLDVDDLGQVGIQRVVSGSLRVENSAGLIDLKLFCVFVLIRSEDGFRSRARVATTKRRA